MMIVSFGLIMLVCLIGAIRAEDRTIRLALVGFFLLNLLAAAVALIEGNAFKPAPDVDQDPSYYRD
jgi:Na+/H+-dicarboxylate symporter